MDAPLSIYIPLRFMDHAGRAEHNGRVYNFRTSEAAAKFLNRVTRRSGIGSTRASDVHKPAQRTGDRPECIRRLDVKAALSVERTPPPDGNRPSPALRIVRAADEAAELAA